MKLTDLDWAVVTIFAAGPPRLFIATCLVIWLYGGIKPFLHECCATFRQAGL